MKLTPQELITNNMFKGVAGQARVCEKHGRNRKDGGEERYNGDGGSTGCVYILCDRKQVLLPAELK
jgi:hypothetical protein